MPKAALVSILTAFAFLHSAQSQEPSHFGGTQSLGISSTYSPDSSHILIGTAEQRRNWTAGLEYTHRIASSRHLRWDYEATLLPFYLESDPTVIAIKTTIAGVTYLTPQTPVRVIQVVRGPVGYAFAGKNLTAPIYALYGRENTYGGALNPLGVRTTLFQRSRIQPSFAVDTGFVVAIRDLPIDGSDRFNFAFSFGPGVQVFTGARSSARLEYIFHHISNAGLGAQNPGVDQGTFRLTLSRFRNR